MSKILLETVNLKKTYDHKNGTINLFDNVNINADEVFKKLANKRLILRTLKQYKIPNSLRFTIGNKQVNEYFIKTIKNILK